MLQYNASKSVASTGKRTMCKENTMPDAAMKNTPRGTSFVGTRQADSTNTRQTTVQGGKCRSEGQICIGMGRTRHSKNQRIRKRTAGGTGKGGAREGSAETPLPLHGAHGG